MPRVAQKTTPTQQGEQPAPEGRLVWVVIAALVASSVAFTVGGQLLPETESTLRVISTILGVLLTAVAGIYASYGITRAATAREVEAQYNGYLTGVAISVAHVYSTLQHATATRRSGIYVHEETYQEAVIMSAEALLTQFDAITRLSGSVDDGLVTKKQELEAMRAGLFDRAAETTDAIASLELRTSPPLPEPIATRCPNCDARVTGRLALRAGWTTKIVCPNCRSSFNVHRRSDMSVYVGGIRTGESKGTLPPADPVPNPDSPTTEPVVEEALSHTNTDISDDERRVHTLSCPGCGRSIIGRFAREHRRPTHIRTCLHCFRFIVIDAKTLAINSSEPVTLVEGEATGRRGSYPETPCPIDTFPLRASFSAEGDDRWFAVCVSHRQIVSISRPAYRTWLEKEDPAYLSRRLETEEEPGSRRIVSDQPVAEPIPVDRP